MNFDILFPDTRESGETPLRQSQLVMLRMLKIFDHLCKKHDIRYFLVGGSLLGAVRHQGFIPWDDDLDVGMTRDQYEKFVQKALLDLPNDIFFQTPETDPHFPSCGRVEAKLKDKYSSYKNFKEKAHQKHHLGLQMDIFVYDRAYLPNNALIYALNRALEIYFWKMGVNNKSHLKRAKVLKAISRFTPVPLVYASSFIISRKMIKGGDNFIRKAEIENLIRTKFEDMDVLIPQGWDACLKRQYGNYMELPPVEKQIGHHSADLPDPFTPCDHIEILHWKDRKSVKKYATKAQ